MQLGNITGDTDRSEDAGRDMKARLRADLHTAMKDRRAIDAKVIRSLVAAIDNAEAPTIQAGRTAPALHDLRRGSAEVERLLLSTSQVRHVLLAEIHEREQAATELEHLDEMDRAEVLGAEARLAKRYIE